MDTNFYNIIEINMKDLLHYLLRKLWLIILAGIITGVIARYYSINYITPTYVSSAKLYLINNQEGQSMTLSDLQIGTYLAQDYSYLIKSRPVSEEVIKRLKLNLTSDQLSHFISVYSPEGTRVLIISVTYSDKNKIKTLIDTIAQVSSEKIVSLMGMKEVNIIEDGSYPGSPISPDIHKNTMLAACAGTVFFTILFTLLFLLNDSIKSFEDIEKHLGLTTLGIIPIQMNDKKRIKLKDKKTKAA